jgi:hypothetical protein
MKSSKIFAGVAVAVLNIALCTVVLAQPEMEKRRSPLV